MPGKSFLEQLQEWIPPSCTPADTFKGIARDRRLTGFKIPIPEIDARRLAARSLEAPPQTGYWSRERMLADMRNSVTLAARNAVEFYDRKHQETQWENEGGAAVQ